MPNTSQSVAIPSPQGTLESHQATLMALKEAVELLLNQRSGAAAGGGGLHPQALAPAAVTTTKRDRTQMLLDAYREPQP